MIIECKELAKRLKCNLQKLNNIIDSWRFGHIEKIKLDGVKTKAFKGISKDDIKELKRILDKKRTKYPLKSKRLDLTGKKFGRLTAINIIGKTKYGVCVWQCLCDCGNLKNVPVTYLTQGYTKSCGCLKKEVAFQRGKSNAKKQV